MSTLDRSGMEWDKLLAEYGKRSGLSQDVQTQAQRAVAFLRQQFGESLPTTATPGENPFRCAIKDPRWAIFISSCLEKVSGAPGYERLRAKLLRKRKDYSEALSVLENASRLAESGFDIEFEPKVQVAGKQGMQEKRPDLKLVFAPTKELFIVEVAEQGPSEREKASEYTGFEIGMPMIKIIEQPEQTMMQMEPFGEWPNVRTCGRIFRALHGQERKEARDAVRNKMMQVHRNKRFDTLTIPDVLELGFAPQEDYAMQEIWAKQRGYRASEIMGPPDGEDRAERVRSKINKEVKQLPTDSAGIVIIKHPTMVMGSIAGVKPLPRYDMATFVDTIAEEWDKFPQVLLMILSNAVNLAGDWGHGLNCSCGFHRLRTKQLVTGQSRQDLVILNQSCRIAVTPVALARLYYAFTGF